MSGSSTTQEITWSLDEIPETVPSVPESVGVGNTNSTPKRVNACKTWCFTWNNYTQDDIKSLISAFGSTGASFYVFQEETGLGGTKHLQGVVGFKRKLRPKNLFSNKIHWEICRNKKASIAYCQKEDTRTGNVFSHGVRVDTVLKYLKRSNFKNWQRKLKEELNGDPHPRKIIWIWESVGGVGKSAMAKHLVIEDGALVVSGKAADVKYGIVKWKESKGCYPTIIILDVPRSYADYVSYQGIEEIKNGLFFSSKYESEMVVYNPPHIVVFANTMPDRNKMSKDRWDVREIAACGARGPEGPENSLESWGGSDEAWLREQDKLIDEEIMRGWDEFNKKRRVEEIDLTVQ